jgi:excisionase family DNA binding protein
MVITESQIKVMGSERRAWSITETCQKVGVSRNFLLGQIQRGLLRARRLGRRIVILNEDLEAYLKNAEQVVPTGPDQQN